MSTMTAAPLYTVPTFSTFMQQTPPQGEVLAEQVLVSGSDLDPTPVLRAVVTTRPALRRNKPHRYGIWLVNGLGLTNGMTATTVDTPAEVREVISQMLADVAAGTFGKRA